MGGHIAGNILSGCFYSDICSNCTDTGREKYYYQTGQSERMGLCVALRGRVSVLWETWGYKRPTDLDISNRIANDNHLRPAFLGTDTGRTDKTQVGKREHINVDGENENHIKNQME